MFQLGVSERGNFECLIIYQYETIVSRPHYVVQLSALEKNDRVGDNSFAQIRKYNFLDI